MLGKFISSFQWKISTMMTRHHKCTARSISNDYCWHSSGVEERERGNWILLLTSVAARARERNWSTIFFSFFLSFSHFIYMHTPISVHLLETAKKRGQAEWQLFPTSKCPLRYKTQSMTNSVLFNYEKKTKTILFLVIIYSFVV
jgi:hypothetical protein